MKIDAFAQLNRALRSLDAEQLRAVADECLRRAGVTRIWAVESGEYSDYRVHAVFLDRSEAETHAGRVSDGEVAEMPFNVFVTDKRPAFRVYMGEDGSSTVKPADISYEIPGEESFWRAGRHSENRWNLVAVVQADDEQHAAKIVNEKRAQKIAAGEWPR